MRERDLKKSQTASQCLAWLAWLASLASQQRCLAAPGDNYKATRAAAKAGWEAKAYRRSVWTPCECKSLQGLLLHPARAADENKIL